MPPTIAFSRPPDERGRRIVAMALGLLWLLAGWFLVVPLGWPRGAWLFGKYQLRDLYLGGVALLLAAATTALHRILYRRAGELARRALAVCLGLLFGGLAAEIGYLLLIRQPWTSNMWLDNAWIHPLANDADPELGYRRKPNLTWGDSYRSDEHGFPNRMGIVEADLVFLGDSFTEAGQFGGISEDRGFVRRTGGLLGQTVVNLGLAGYGPQQELVLLRRYGFRYRPRVVIWQLFEGNDLQDAARYARWRADPEGTRPSFFERYANYSLLSWSLAGTMRDPDAARTHTLRLSDGSSVPVRLVGRHVPDAPRLQELGWRELERALSAGAEECRRRGVRLLVFTIPILARVLHEDLDLGSKADLVEYLPSGAGPVQGDFDDSVARLCARLEVDHVDTLPGLRQRARSDNRRLFILGDEHLDTEGHEVVAQVLADRLRKPDADQDRR